MLYPVESALCPRNDFYYLCEFNVYWRTVDDPYKRIFKDESIGSWKGQYGSHAVVLHYLSQGLVKPAA